jgi:hypothetical protein
MKTKDAVYQLLGYAGEVIKEVLEWTRNLRFHPPKPRGYYLPAATMPDITPTHPYMRRRPTNWFMPTYTRIGHGRKETKK